MACCYAPPKAILSLIGEGAFVSTGISICWARSGVSSGDTRGCSSAISSSYVIGIVIWNDDIIYFNFVGA
jgi:hypothetical protein